MSINKHEQVTQEKIGMTHGSSSFTLRLKTHKFKLFDKRFNQEVLKSIQLANCTGPGQLNHINDNPHIYAGNNQSTRLGPAWTQTHN